MDGLRVCAWETSHIGPDGDCVGDAAHATWKEPGRCATAVVLQQDMPDLNPI